MITIVLTLIVIGVLLWLVTTFIPMNSTIKQIIIAVVIICTVIWLLQATGLWNEAKKVGVPHI